MTNPAGRPSVTNIAFIPPQINSLEDTGLSPLWLQDLVLKVLYSRGYMTGFKIAEEIALPFAGVTDQLLTSLKQEKLIEVKSSQGGTWARAHTPMALQALAICTRVKPWSAASTPDLRPCHLTSITKPSAARRADA